MRLRTWVVTPSALDHSRANTLLLSLCLPISISGNWLHHCFGTVFPVLFSRFKRVIFAVFFNYFGTVCVDFGNSVIFCLSMNFRFICSCYLIWTRLLNLLCLGFLILELHVLISWLRYIKWYEWIWYWYFDNASFVSYMPYDCSWSDLNFFVLMVAYCFSMTDLG